MHKPDKHAECSATAHHELRRFPGPCARAGSGARSSPCGATSCSTPTRPSRRSPSCATDRSRSCSSRRRRAARRGRATPSWAPRRARRGGCVDGVVKTGRPSAAGTTRAARRIRSTISSAARALRAGRCAGAGRVLERRRRLLRLRRRARHRAAAEAADGGVDVPDALFVFTDALGHHRQPASRRRAWSCGARVDADASDATLRARVRHARCARSSARSRRSAAPVRARRRSISTPTRQPAEGVSNYDAREVPRRRRAHPRVHPGRRRVSGAARAAHRRAVRFPVRVALSRAARASIRRRTCITSCSTAWSSSAARPSCWCA